MPLRPISIDVLYEGMVVDFAIYAYQDGTSVLLCKDTVLDKKKLEVIREAVRFGKNVYIKKENRDRILYENAYFSEAQKRIEKKVGYDEMKGIAQDFLERVHSTGFVSSQAVNALVEEIQQKLSDFDNAHITQCLNGTRSLLKSNDADSQRMGVGVFCRLRGGAESFSQRSFFLAGLCGTLLLLCL